MGRWVGMKSNGPPIPIDKPLPPAPSIDNELVFIFTLDWTAGGLVGLARLGATKFNCLKLRIEIIFCSYQRFNGSFS
jgi:hypothetical protein